MTYIPTDEGSNSEMLEVGSNLATELQVLPLLEGGSLIGTNRTSEIIDDVLQVSVNYNFHIGTDLNETMLESIDVMKGELDG